MLVQEYGRYFGMATCCLRCGCLTGPQHSGVELHGFLSFLVKCNLEQRTYNIYGYKGKQVRDNIHSRDVAHFIDRFLQAPRVAEVYNLGGGRENSCSLLEAFAQTETITGFVQKTMYIDDARQGDLPARETWATASSGAARCAVMPLCGSWWGAGLDRGGQGLADGG